MIIKNMTTAYDADEDRLRLAVSDDGGQRRLLWVTRRLAERLAPALLQGLTVAAPEEGEPESEEAQREAASRSQAAQAYAQLEARLASRPTAAVEIPPEAPVGLVQRIELKSGDAGTRVMEFHCPGQVPCVLALNPRELRQWLGQLRAAFQAAEWRQDFWPVWVQAR